ncbi:MAG: hypothetical protein IPH75_16355 [bacterium]|nr:hypothetical protein [bacterium]
MSSDETDGIVNFICWEAKDRHATTPGISQTNADKEESDGVDLGDPLFREACEVVVRHKQGSVSLPASTGHRLSATGPANRTRRSGDRFPFDGSKAREVIVDKTYL